MFTHYSLFENETAVADFAPIANLEEVLADFQRRALPGQPSMCIGPKTTLHPDGSQMSLSARDGDLLLILMTQTAVKAQATELSFERNASAKRAVAAIE